MNRLICLSKGTWRCILCALITLVGTSLLAVILLTLAVGLLLGTQSKTALAQSGSNGLITNTTVADFGVCTVLTDVVPTPVLTNIVFTNSDGGEIRLRAVLEDYFDQGPLDTSRWTAVFVDSPGPYTPTFVGGSIELVNPSTATVGARVGSNNTYLYETVEGRVRFTPSNEEIIGFSTFSDTWAVISTWINPNNVYAWSNTPGNEQVTLLTNTPTIFHDYRVVWGPASIEYWVDGAPVATHTRTISVPMYAHLTNWFGVGSNVLTADWLRVANYAVPSGMFISCIQDAGQVVNWNTLSWVASVPVSTTLTFHTRTSLDGEAWSAWSAPLSSSGSSVASPSGRYLQYRAELATAAFNESPEVQQVSLSYSRPSSLLVSPTLVVLDPDTSQQFSVQAYDDNGRPVDGLNYGWQIVNGGAQINSTGSTTVSATSVVTDAIYTNTVVAGESSSGLTGTATIVVNNIAPTATILGTFIGQVGVPINFVGQSLDANNDPLTYTWQFGDGGLGMGMATTHVYAKAGIYLVVLTVTDDNGATGVNSTTTTLKDIIFLPVILR
jgi:hypothetical protein